MKQKEIAIGEVAEIDGVKVKCVDDCSGMQDFKCALKNLGICHTIACAKHERSDTKSVYFVKI